MKHSILDFNSKNLQAYLNKHNFPGFAGRQIFSWIYKKGIFDFARMGNLSKELRGFLKNNFSVLNFNLINKATSRDGTQKFLFLLPDGEAIESVLIPAASRLSACVSTQVGCKFNCRFCASGSLGVRRNLKPGEIIEQVIHLHSAAGKRINNLVFMGVGEPFDNYDNLLAAIRILNASDSLNIGARKMTISTCGLLPGIKKLSRENIQVELSVSLHAADNQTRTFLMPVNKKYPLEELLSACRDYYKQTKRQVTFEYILIQGINCGLKQADKLAGMLSGFDAKVNLIPINVFRDQFSAPKKSDVILFRDILLKAGVPATIRRQRGADIEAACGQLRIKKE
ncbi:23S rRNA (adenine(2503)-C(2))-methyltransferase RlmN [Candidatus Omnitrophota bacterium]